MSLINFSGIASGIDSNALIDATKAARKAQMVTPKEDRITELTDTNDALTTLKDKLNNLKTLSRAFATINNGGLVKNARSSDETIFTATAQAGASNGTYSLTVTQLAKNATGSLKSTAGTYTSSTSVVSAAASGNITFTIGSLEGSTDERKTVTVAVTAGSTTLDDIATSFNNSTALAGRAVASVVNVGSTSSPDYRLVVNTNSEGTLKGALSVSVDSALTTANVFNSNTVSNATNATMTVSGIPDTITRTSNTFSDVIPGVTISLVNTSVSSVTLNVSDDAQASASKIQDFVDAYNELVNYIKENDSVTRDESGTDVQNIFGPLANSATDEGLLTALRSAISGTKYETGNYARIMAELGVTTERDGTLKFDSDTFEEVLGNDPESVRQVLQRFGDTLGNTGGTIDIYVRFNGLLDISINSNKELITSLNDQITRAEASIAKEEESLRARFARLESLIGQLQSQQNSLNSALAGLQ